MTRLALYTARVGLSARCGFTNSARCFSSTGSVLAEKEPEDPATDPKQGGDGFLGVSIFSIHLDDIL